MISTSGHLISNFPEVRFHRTRIFNFSINGNDSVQAAQYRIVVDIQRNINPDIVWLIFRFSAWLIDNLLIGVWLGKNTPVTQKNPTSGFLIHRSDSFTKVHATSRILHSRNYSAAASVFSSAVVAAAPTVIVLEVTTGAASSVAAVSVDASSV